MRKLSRPLMKDRETNFSYNDKDLEATVVSYNIKMIEKLRALVDRFPNEVKVLQDQGIFIEVSMPKEWVKIVPPRNLTDEQRANARERMSINRSKRVLKNKKTQE